MRKKLSCFLIFSLIVLLLLSSAGCSSSPKESMLTSSSADTQAVITDVKLSSESFLGTGIQMPSADVLKSISIYDGYAHKTVILDAKEDISRILIFLNSIIGDVYPTDENTTMIIGYKLEFNYHEEVNSSLYVDSLVLGMLSFFYSSRVITVTNYSGTELKNKFESYCINQK